MPLSPSPHVLYVSVKHRLVVHLCACGCRAKTVLPLSPADWQLVYDGKTVSIRPSIGNLQLPCRSHYFIVRSRTEWARRMTTGEALVARAANLRAKEKEVRRSRPLGGWWSRWFR